ncbi:hypothetical protein E0Z10_g590 [Xylaria hypoxylon]|uniref:Uncharacterized protein n=1 Tax=Xylaria hypoxylon TaxID=37992 RepID=A0A4Z0ZB39_9PEZI|nr:hypothetical protein E0Z10_g590 [Xylaria hypoxylon]
MLVVPLKSIQQRFDSHLVLVGFDLVLEFTAIVAHFSQTFPFLSSWVDLQEIVMKSAKMKNTPGLRYTLRKYGWISLPSSGGLDRFIKDVHGKELREETWNAFSKCDALVAHMTLN